MSIITMGMINSYYGLYSNTLIFKTKKGFFNKRKKAVIQKKKSKGQKRRPLVWTPFLEYLYDYT